MKILFLGYWGYRDALTASTVFPHLAVLQARPDVEHIRLVTIERGADALDPPALALPFAHPRISFEPLCSPPGRSVLVTKTDDFRRFPRLLQQQAASFGADCLIARGTPAGSLAYLVWRRTGLPFYVESFEPHAQYMREGGVWGRFDPRYLFQRHWERMQKKHARGLMPVAERYRRHLIDDEGLDPEKIATIPCSVDAAAFGFSAPARARVRGALGYADECVVGVYAGKFGGIYYDAEAFGLFRRAADFFGPAFRLLLLSPQPEAELRAKLTAAGVTSAQVTVRFVAFGEVPDYLAAADFAFNLHRPTPFVSPVKIGEYWANGLPVLLPPGIGDDSDIVVAEGGGAVFDLNQPGSVPVALAAIAALLARPGTRARIPEIARRLRSPDRARLAYAALLPAG